ncbi:MAG: phospholipase D-like domain-containing protein [Chitinophagales bacterium]
MSKIKNAKAYSNNEVGFLSWEIGGTIKNCVGFEITRIYVDSGEEKVLPAWVPFKGQSNPDWKPQTTGVWPIQKLTWRDLTLRRRRDATETHRIEETVKYRIRPVVLAAAGLKPVQNIPEKAYTGKAIPLCYFDEGTETNEITPSIEYGNIQNAFTNGILAAQWLKHAFESNNESLSVNSIKGHITQPNDKFRKYLAGDVTGLLIKLLSEAKSGYKVRMALYELKDEELVAAIIANKARVEIILSNTGKKEGTTEWDETNEDSRKSLKKEGVTFTNRMFNNGHIGHNKFAVLLKGNKPIKVMTGSTNWTSSGLCTQSNNAVIIDSDKVAVEYNNYWELLLADTQNFTTPKPMSASTKNKQGPAIRTANAAGGNTNTLDDGTEITTWYSPNTKATTKGKDLPPDLAYVYSNMRKVEKAIFFAAFLPSRSGKLSIIEEAISIGTKDPSILVYGAISDPTAMPNYVAPKKKSGEDEEDVVEEKKKPSPTVFEKGKISIVRASALTKGDLVGDFEVELLKYGHAIIHDKIVVVDPLSDKGFVVMGSHNLGYKASYENDENLLIIRNNKALVQAYMVHLLDIWEHYRFRAVMQDLKNKHKQTWDGFLSKDDKWLSNTKVELSKYLCG